MRQYIKIMMMAVVATLMCACEDSKSYSDLLKEEEHAVNWYLSEHTVCLEIPADGNFKIGADAPFYKMDKDGYVYMQVLNAGDPDSKPEKGDRVYFRFERQNIKILWEGSGASWVGNSENLDSALGNTFLVYGNKVLTSSTQYGEGIQVPLDYLGYNCEVNLIIKSPEGFAKDSSECNPYIYNIRYFKAIY